jgi:hypothetical protein
MSDTDTDPALIEPNPIDPVVSQPVADEPSPAKVINTDVVQSQYDNELHDGVFCQCTLTFADGSKAEGVAERTNSLANDQAAAYADALTNQGA